MSHKWMRKANRWSQIKGKQSSQWKLSGVVDERGTAVDLSQVIVYYSNEWVLMI